jgi:hypothetical protein
MEVPKATAAVSPSVDPLDHGRLEPRSDIVASWMQMHLHLSERGGDSDEAKYPVKRAVLERESMFESERIHPRSHAPRTPSGMLLRGPLLEHLMMQGTNLVFLCHHGLPGRLSKGALLIRCVSDAYRVGSVVSCVQMALGEKSYCKNHVKHSWLSPVSTYTFRTSPSRVFW